MLVGGGLVQQGDAETREGAGERRGAAAVIADDEYDVRHGTLLRGR